MQHTIISYRVQQIASLSLLIIGPLVIPEIFLHWSAIKMALLNYLKFINRYKKLSRICRARGPSPQMSNRASYGQYSGLSCHLLTLLMHNRALMSLTEVCYPLWPLPQFITPERKGEPSRVPAARLPPLLTALATAMLKIYGQAHWRQHPSFPSSGFFQFSVLRKPKKMCPQWIACDSVCFYLRNLRRDG